MMLWQRGPKNERSDEEYPKIGRARILNPDKLAPIHKLDHAFIPKERPSPIFDNDVEITPKNWFNKRNQMGNKRNQNSKTPHGCWHGIMTKNKQFPHGQLLMKQ